MEDKVARLSGIKQALSVLEHLSDGCTKENVIALCDDDERCVSAWISFLKDIDWLKENEHGKMVLTEKGRGRLKMEEIHA